MFQRHALVLTVMSLPVASKDSLLFSFFSVVLTVMSLPVVVTSHVSCVTCHASRVMCHALVLTVMSLPVAVTMSSSEGMLTADSTMDPEEEDGIRNVE